MCVAVYNELICIPLLTTSVKNISCFNFHKGTTKIILQQKFADLWHMYTALADEAMPGSQMKPGIIAFVMPISQSTTWHAGCTRM